jgi:hypothetical protein
MTDQSSRQGGCPTTNKTATLSWLQSKSGHEFWRSSTQRLTDWLTVRCKVTETLTSLLCQTFTWNSNTYMQVLFFVSRKTVSTTWRAYIICLHVISSSKTSLNIVMKTAVIMKSFVAAAPYFTFLFCVYTQWNSVPICIKNFHTSEDIISISIFVINSFSDMTYTHSDPCPSETLSLILPPFNLKSNYSLQS